MKDMQIGDFVKSDHGKGRVIEYKFKAGVDTYMVRHTDGLEEWYPVGLLTKLPQKPWSQKQILSAFIDSANEGQGHA